MQPLLLLGLHWVGLGVPVGRLNAAEMAELARLARQYGSGELRFSEAQNVLSINVPGAHLEG
ncbi:MAG: ferredoxin--nitrite reductase, partial [Cyanobacteriota bacterium]